MLTSESELYKLCQIITLSGNKRVGKDTLADHLVNDYGFVKISLADSLKDVTRSLFKLFYNINLSNQELYGDDKDKIMFGIGKLTNNDPDGIMVYKGNICRGCKRVSLRQFLQIIGTDIGRKYIMDDIWILSIDKKIKNLIRNRIKSKYKIPKNGILLRIVIPDARYQNEIDFFRKRYEDVTSIKINRDVSENNKKTAENLHMSERAHLLKVDHVIDNNKTKYDMYGAFDKLIGNNMRNKKNKYNCNNGRIIWFVISLLISYMTCIYILSILSNKYSFDN
jgi:hypothetical protein